jgi:hypothetical protein
VDVIRAGNELLEVQLHNPPPPAPAKPEASIPTRTSKQRKPKRQTDTKAKDNFDSVCKSDRASSRPPEGSD